MRVLARDGSPCEIRDEDVLYFTSYQNTIVVHTSEDEFIYPASLSDLVAAYRSIGFERMDRSNVVNTGNVTEYDPDRKVVLFGPGTGKFATVSEPNEKKAKKLGNHYDKDST